VFVVKQTPRATVSLKFYQFSNTLAAVFVGYLGCGVSNSLTPE